MSSPSSSSSSISKRVADSERELRSLRPDSPSWQTIRPRARSTCASSYFTERTCSAPALFQTASKAESSSLSLARGKTLPDLGLFTSAARRQSSPLSVHDASAALLEIVELRRQCLEHTTPKSLITRCQSCVSDGESPKPTDGALFNEFFGAAIAEPYQEDYTMTHGKLGRALPQGHEERTHTSCFELASPSASFSSSSSEQKRTWSPRPDSPSITEEAMFNAVFGAAVATMPTLRASSCGASVASTSSSRLSSPCSSSSLSSRARSPSSADLAPSASWLLAHAASHQHAKNKRTQNKARTRAARAAAATRRTTTTTRSSTT